LIEGVAAVIESVYTGSAFLLLVIVFGEAVFVGASRH
jgi:hypothetical protein